MLKSRYGELLRIFGETDAHEVWGSATAFELAKWSASKSEVRFAVVNDVGVGSL
jgi:hypothetical protein